MLALATCERLPLADGSVDFIWTDPPYLRSFIPVYGWLATEAKRILKPGGFIIAMCGGLHLNRIMRMFDDAGLDWFFEFQQQSNGDAPVVWKHYADQLDYPIVARCKPILCYSNGPGRPRVGGVMNTFEATHGWSKQWHHWGQDVASARYYIDYFSAEGDLVCDPFVGGGTTMVACKLIKRRCIGFDIDPAALRTSQARLANADIYHQLPMFADLEVLNVR